MRTVVKIQNRTKKRYLWSLAFGKNFKRFANGMLTLPNGNQKNWYWEEGGIKENKGNAKRGVSPRLKI
jgi:hypothetical protein